MKVMIHHSWIDAMDNMDWVEVVNSGSQAATFKTGKAYLEDVHDAQEVCLGKSGVVTSDPDSRWAAGATDDPSSTCDVTYISGRIVIADTDSSALNDHEFTMDDALDIDADWVELEVDFTACDYLEFLFRDPYGDTVDTGTICKLTIENEHLYIYDEDRATTEDLGDISGSRHLIRVAFDFTGMTVAVTVDGTQVNASITALWQVSNATTSGFEGFSYVDDAEISAITPWAVDTGAADANRYFKAVAASGDAHFYDADSVNSWVVKYTFPTASAADPTGAWVSWKAKIVSSSGTSSGFVIRNAANYNIDLRFTSDGKVKYVKSDFSQNDTGLTWSAHTYATWKVVVTAAGTFTLSKNGGTPASCICRVNFAAAITNFAIGSFTTSNMECYVDDIVTSWATAGPDGVLIDPTQCTMFSARTTDAAEDVEVNLYSIKTNKDGLVDSLLDKWLKVLSDDGDEWMYVGKIDQVADVNDWRILTVKDGLVQLEESQCPIDYVKMSDAVASYTGGVNNITLDNTPPGDIPGCGLMVSFTEVGGRVTRYDQDSAGDISAKVAAAGDVTISKGSTSSGDGTSTNLNDDVVHLIVGGVGLINSRVRCDYKLTMGTAIGAVDLLHPVIKASVFFHGFGMGSWFIRVSAVRYNSSGVETGEFMLYNTSGGFIFETSQNIDALNEPPVDCIKNRDTTPEIHLRFYLGSGGALGDHDVHLRVDYLRCHVRTNERFHDPIECLITGVDTASKKVYTTTAPMLDGYARDGDDVIIGYDRNSVIASLPMGKDVEMKPHTFLAHDCRGMDNRQLLGLLQQKYQGYYYTIPDDHGFPCLSFKDSLGYIHFAEFFNNQPASTDIDDYSGRWTLAGDGAGATIKTEKHAAYGWNLNVLASADCSGTNLVATHDITDPRTHGLLEWQCGLQFGLAGASPTAGTYATIFFKDVIGTTLIKIEIDEAGKLYVTDAAAKSNALEYSTGNDIVLPSDDFTVIKVKFLTNTTYKIYVQQGYTTAAANDPTFTEVSDGARAFAVAHRVVTTMEWVFDRNYTTDVDDDLTLRVNCMRWRMERLIGLYTDEWFDVAEGTRLHDVDGTQWFDYGAYVEDANTYIKITADATCTFYAGTGTDTALVREMTAFWVGNKFTWNIKRLGVGDGYMYITFCGSGGAQTAYKIIDTTGAIYYQNSVAAFVDTTATIGTAFTKLTLEMTDDNPVKFKLYVADVLIGEFTGWGVFTDVTYIVMSMSGNAAGFEVEYMNFEGILPGNVYSITLQPGGKKLEQATSLKSVTVLGRKNDIEITVPDPVIPDPSIDDYSDPDSPRTAYIVDSILEEAATLRDKAVAILEQNTSNKVTIIANPVTDLVYHVGNYYRFQLDGEWYYDMFCRRVSFSWAFKDGIGLKKWTVEFGTGSTTGIEKQIKFHQLINDTFKSYSIRDR